MHITYSRGVHKFVCAILQSDVNCKFALLCVQLVKFAFDWLESVHLYITYNAICTTNTIEQTSSAAAKIFST